MNNSQSSNEPSRSQAALEAPSTKHPRSVTLLALGVLIITVINLIRLVLSIRYWSFLNSRLGISPLYLALTGLIWTIAGSLLIWGLWRAKNWAPKLMQAVALTYTLYYWLDLIFVKDHLVSGESGAISALLPINWQFSAGVTVVCLGYMVWTLGRSKVKAYFGLVKSETDQSQVNNDDLG
jgi:hypothetical protein